MNFLIPSSFRLTSMPWTFARLQKSNCQEFLDAVTASEDFLTPWIRFGQPGAYTLESMMRYFEDQESLLVNLQEFHFGIFDPSGSLMGSWTFHLNGRRMADRVAEISLWLRRDHANRGLGLKVLDAIIQWGFSEWPWYRLEWHCNHRNQASRKLAQKAGFRLESKTRQSMRDHLGHWIDTDVLAMNKYPLLEANPLDEGAMHAVRVLNESDFKNAGGVFSDCIHDLYQDVLPFHMIAGLNSKSSQIALQKRWQKQTEGLLKNSWLGVFGRINSLDESLLGFVYLERHSQDNQLLVCRGPFVPGPYRGYGIGKFLMAELCQRFAGFDLLVRYPHSNESFERFLLQHNAQKGSTIQDSQWQTNWSEARILKLNAS